MTFTEFAAQPEVVLALLGGMLSVLVVIAGLIYRIAQTVVPVFLSFRIDFESQKEHCDGRFNIVEMRLDGHDEEFKEIKLKLEDKYVLPPKTQEKRS